MGARALVSQAVMDVLDAQKAATPTLLKQTYRARPGSFPVTPCAYVGGRGETITYDAGTRTRTFVGLTVVVVDSFIEADDAADRMDVVVDLLIDRFTAAYALSGGGGLLQVGAVEDLEIEVPGPAQTAVYRAAVLQLGRPPNATFYSEGRT